MTTFSHSFGEVTLLITHYNRSSSLERLLRTFNDIGCNFGSIIISDDGSQPEHLKKVQELQSIYNFMLLTTPENKGLGNNINKGQDAVTTLYTLYVQEDFVPKASFSVHFTDALTFMQ
ncbi:MAG: glycosyltransferase, partial [Hymenobacter sp.]